MQRSVVGAEVMPTTPRPTVAGETIVVKAINDKSLGGTGLVKTVGGLTFSSAFDRCSPLSRERCWVYFQWEVFLASITFQSKGCAWVVGAKVAFPSETTRYLLICPDILTTPP